MFAWPSLPCWGAEHSQPAARQGGPADVPENGSALPDLSVSARSSRGATRDCQSDLAPVVNVFGGAGRDLCDRGQGCDTRQRRRRRPRRTIDQDAEPVVMASRAGIVMLDFDVAETVNRPAGIEAETPAKHPG